MTLYTPVSAFDWYAATVDAKPDDLVDHLSDRLAATPRHARGLHGYTDGVDLLRGTDVVAKIIHGGQASPHVWASGQDAQDLSVALRAQYPTSHHITRVDASLDFLDGSPWADLYAESVRVADYLPSGDRRARPLRLGTAGDWVRPDGGTGRTLYIGSLKSPVFARLYEKGKQMRALYPDQLDKYAEGWVRLELQIRPQRESRKVLASMSPIEMWGCSKWSADLFAATCGDLVDSVTVQHSRPADDERAYRFMLRQYGGLLARRVAKVAPGDPAARLEAWAELGRELGRAIG